MGINANDLIEAILKKPKLKEAVTAKSLLREISAASDTLNECDSIHSKLEKALLAMDTMLDDLKKAADINDGDEEKLGEIKDLLNEFDTECLADFHRAMKVAMGEVSRVPRLAMDAKELAR